jgi:uncharacterized protein YbjQ (UPF0145 family)
MMVSTANDITGFKIVRHLGIVRGITVRSRSASEIWSAAFSPF